MTFDQGALVLVMGVYILTIVFGAVAQVRLRARIQDLLVQRAALVEANMMVSQYSIDMRDDRDAWVRRCESVGRQYSDMQECICRALDS